MRRDGTNPDDVQPEDVLCDFCLEPAWALNRPCVEGHHGSIICGVCLSKAWVVVQCERDGEAPATCTMCLEDRDEPGWRGDTSAHICKRCIKQAAGAMHKSNDWDWTKPDCS